MIMIFYLGFIGGDIVEIFMYVKKNRKNKIMAYYYNKTKAF